MGEFKTRRVEVIIAVSVLLMINGTALFNIIEKADGAMVYADSVDINKPLSVVIATIIDTEFRVSWITVENVSGYIEYGNSPYDLAMKAYDDRDKEANGAYEGETHHIRVGDWFNPPTNETALIPNSTYYFKIISGGVVYGNSDGIAVIDGEAWNVTTTPTIASDLLTHHFVHGRVIKQDGTTKSRKCIVHCTVLNVTTNTTSAPLSSVVSDPAPPLQPEFGFDFANLRHKNGSIFPFQTGDLMTLSAHGGNEGTGTNITYVLVWDISPFQPRIDMYLHKNSKPNIVITSPSINGGVANNTFTIKWNDFDQDDNAIISLYYDMDNITGGETLIVKDIGEDDEADSYTFSTTDFSADSTFYIKALIEDGFNTPVEVYSEGVVRIDRIVPASVKDLSAKPGINNGEVVLMWSATGNDGNIGRAESYIIRYSSLPINEDNWYSAIIVENDIIPKEFGGIEEYIITNLAPGELFYFGIKVSDGPNLSPISNIASSISQLDFGPPGDIYDLKAVPGVDEGEVILTWTASGDDDYTGRASGYEIRYSNLPIYEGNWEAAIEVNNKLKPQQNGSLEAFTVTNLTPEKKFFFAIKVCDEGENWSNVSNIASAIAKIDRTAPKAITDLRAESGLKNGEVVLKWTASGDDGEFGKARGYMIKYSMSLITEDNWEFATEVENAIDPRMAGEIEEFIVTNLHPGKSYYFGIKALDEAPNLSPISNVVQMEAYSNATKLIMNSPRNGDVYLSINEIFFDGSNTTDPDNTLTFFWTSNIDGTIGNVTKFKIKLSPGTHVITLWVVSDKGDIVSASMNITIMEAAYTRDGESINLFSIRDNNTMIVLLVSIITFLILDIAILYHYKNKKKGLNILEREMESILEREMERKEKK